MALDLVVVRWGGPMSGPEVRPPARAEIDDLAPDVADAATEALPADPAAARAFVEGLFARHHARDLRVPRRGWSATPSSPRT